VSGYQPVAKLSTQVVATSRLSTANNFTSRDGLI